MVSDSPESSYTRIQVVPSDSFNLGLLAQQPSSIDVSPVPPNHQWFAGAFTHLPTDRPLTIQILMGKKPPKSFPVLLWKWVGLRPLLTYADPLAYQSYEWYRRDKYGRWHSGDLWKSPEERFAGRGPLPEQQVIPAALAAQFLSADGLFWWPWREIDTVDTLVEQKTFIIRHHFDAPTANIALHTPFTYTYLQAFLARLQADKPAGVFIDELGQTPEGRKLQVIRVDDPAHCTPLTIGKGATRSKGAATMQITDPPGAAPAQQKVILVTAREHATEHSGSWVIQGILRVLLANTAEAAHLRKNTTWLLLPIYDPDGSANASMNALTNRFFNHKGNPTLGDDTPEEVVAYAKYLRAFVNSGRPIYISATFYGLECNEAAPVCCPAAVQSDLENNLAFNQFWFHRLRKIGIHAGRPEPWETMCVPYRLHGWCSYFYGGLTLPFETNDRHPEQRLTLAQLELIGSDFADAVIKFLDSKAGQQRMLATREFLRDREKKMELWYRTSMAGTIDDPTLYDLLAVGY